MSPSAQNVDEADGIASRIRKRRRESAAVEEPSSKRKRIANAKQDQTMAKSAREQGQTAPALTSSETAVHANDLPAESQPSASTGQIPGAPLSSSQGGRPEESEPATATSMPEGKENDRDLGREITTAIRELVDLQYASRSKDTVASGRTVVPDYGGVDPGTRLRMQSLPILENLAVQILSIFAKSSFQDIVGLMKFPGSEKGPTLATLKSLFNLTLMIYNKERPFLSTNELPLPGEDVNDVFRKANLATWMLAVLGSQDASFFHLNEYFLDTFVPFGHSLQDWQGAMFVELKTQAFINAMILNLNLPKDDILTDLFPPDLERRLISRRTQPTQLSPSEQDFISRAYDRRDLLRAEAVTQDGLTTLIEKFDWIEFLQEVTATANKHSGAIIGDAAPSLSMDTAWSTAGPLPLDQSQGSALQGQDLSVRNAFSPAREERQSSSAYVAMHGPLDSSRYSQILDLQSPSPYPQPAFGDTVSGSQGEPTRVLYQRARLAATAKTTPSNRRAGGASQRRPWSAEEEAALMAGLDRVRGPHWSQILAMFGAGGTVSEVLKDRNQVQLKDKARNLKLFFLKSGNEVPPYLQAVTGELKTRAPAQVRKEEATESLRDSVDVDKATVDAINLLAAGSRQALEAQQGVDASGNQDEDDDGDMHEEAPDEIQAALARAMEAMNQPHHQYVSQSYSEQLQTAANGSYNIYNDPHAAAREAQFLTQKAAIQAADDAAREALERSEMRYQQQLQQQQSTAFMTRGGDGRTDF